MFDRVHFYFSFGGTYLGVTEIWQSGFRAAPGTQRTEGELLGALSEISVEDCFDDLGAVINNPSFNVGFHLSLKLTWAKLAVIKTDGKYAGSPKIHEGMYSGAMSAGNPPPPQLAWAATLGTGKSFGMAQKGRMYWPVPSAVPAMINSSTGQVLPGYSVEFRDLIKPCLEAIEGEISTIDVPAFIAVMSKSGGVSAPQAPGTTNAVTEISVGKAIDTMRSRRSNVQEQYEPVPALRGTRSGLYATPNGSEDQTPVSDTDVSPEEPRGRRSK